MDGTRPSEPEEMSTVKSGIIIYSSPTHDS